MVPSNPGEYVKESDYQALRKASNKSGIDNVELFICYLIDICEGDEITEEGLQHSLAYFLKNPKYNQNYIKITDNKPDEAPPEKP